MIILLLLSALRLYPFSVLQLFHMDMLRYRVHHARFRGPTLPKCSCIITTSPSYRTTCITPYSAVKNSVVTSDDQQLVIELDKLVCLLPVRVRSILDNHPDKAKVERY